MTSTEVQAAVPSEVAARWRDRRYLGSIRRTGPASVRGLLPLAVLIALWQLLGSPRSPFLPSPSAWIDSLAGLCSDGTLWPAVLATLSTVALGLSIATLLGVAIGFAVGASARVDRSLNPTFELLRATPPAVLVPVATLVFGYQQSMKVTIVVVATIWPILLKTRAGVHGLEPRLVDVARSLQLSTAARLRKVLLPALLPSIFLGIRVAAPITVVITLLVEILTGVEGVGALISLSQRTFRPASVYGLVVVAGLISLLVNTIVHGVESHVFRHGSVPSARGARRGRGGTLLQP